MDNFKEISEVIRRGSLISVSKPDELVNKLTKDPHKPKDSFYLVYVLCLLFGLLSMLPLTFFVTANDYWMYKFRDTSKETVDLNNKTTLQKYFTSGSMVFQTIPSVASMLLSTSFGHRFKINSRFVGTSSYVITIFILFTIFINVNTDTWQLGFFILTLVGLASLTCTLNLLQVTCMAVVPKFPPPYMKTFLLGQGMAAIFSATLQIVSLSLGSSTITSALFYFISGNVIIFISFGMYLVISRTAFYQYYMQIELEDTKKKYTKEQIKTTFFQIWPCLAIMITMFISMSMTHPAITSLVVSENYGKGNKWNDVYFVPAITYLFTEICTNFGRLLSRPIVSKKTGPWIVGFVVLRMAVLVPLLILCNAQPRNNLPVLLTHDYQYILVCIAFFVSAGFILNTAFLSIPKLAKENEDVAYMIMLSFIGICAGALSPVSLVVVRIL